MARSERSAGVVVFRVEPQSPDGRVYLLLDYGRHWDYPKGHIHKKEAEREAALRELREETGIDDVRLIEGFRQEMKYFFRRRGSGTVAKTVVFFLGETQRAEVRISDEHVGYVYLPYEQALEKLTFATAKKLLESAEAFLGQQGKDRGAP